MSSEHSEFQIVKAVAGKVRRPVVVTVCI